MVIVGISHDSACGPLIMGVRSVPSSDPRRGATLEHDIMNNTYTQHAANEQAIADQWLEDNASLLIEHASANRATDARLEFGCEYFDAAGSDVDLDDMDYFTRMGQASVSEATQTVYRVAADKPVTVHHPKFEAGTFHADADGDYVQGSISRSHMTDELHIPDTVAVTELPYRGEPRTVRKAAAKRNELNATNVAESHRIAQLANKDRQKARRLARKEQITLNAAMDRLGF